MKRYLIVGGLLAALIAAGFFLPPRVMEWQDQRRIGNAETEEVQEVVLKEQASMTLLQRLLLRNREGEEVDALKLVNGKNYTEDTIGEQVRAEIRTLIELGILKGLDLEDVLSVEASVLFYVDLVDTEKSAMIWSGTVLTGNCRLDFELDDESGKIVEISQHYYRNNYREPLSVVGDAENEEMEGDVVVEKSWEISSDDELRAVAEQWGEYLGCTVTDVGYNLEPYFSGREEEAFQREVEEMMKKGYSEEEALWMAASAWGILEDEAVWLGRKVLLGDKETEATYILRSDRGVAIQISCRY